MKKLNRADWLQTPLGQYLLAQETTMYGEAVENCFGYNALQIGFSQMDLLQNARTLRQYQTDIDVGEVRCHDDELPFQSNSIDLLLLPHTLEFSRNPHECLREAERVLVPEGHLIISGFNPLSLWGARQLFGRQQGYPWNGQFLQIHRVRDWLALLGCEVTACTTRCFTPPLLSERWLRRCKIMDNNEGRWGNFGGVYFIIAKKRVLNMRVIKPNWATNKIKPRLVAVPSRRDSANRRQPEPASNKTKL